MGIGTHNRGAGGGLILEKPDLMFSLRIFPFRARTMRTSRSATAVTAPTTHCQQSSIPRPCLDSPTEPATTALLVGVDEEVLSCDETGNVDGFPDESTFPAAAGSAVPDIDALSDSPFELSRAVGVGTAPGSTVIAKVDAANEGVLKGFAGSTLVGIVGVKEVSIRMACVDSPSTARAEACGAMVVS